MTDIYSGDQIVTMVEQLTHHQLISFINAEVVTPVHTEHGLVFSKVDLVRIELLCELSEQFDLDDDALGVVISLIDQLHGVRAELRTVLEVIETEPVDVQNRIGKALQYARTHQ